MAQLPQPATTPTDEEENATPELRLGLSLPSWGISLVLHAVLVIILGFFIELAPRGVASEGNRSVGIALSSTNSSGQKSFSDETGDGTSSGNPSSTSSAEGSASTSLTDSKQLTEGVSGTLPSSGPPVIGVSGGTSNLLPDAGGMTGGAKGTGGTKGGGSSSSTSVFGVQGSGTKFVFVFDRSLSMSGHPMRAAQAELVASLQGLADNHEFQIIFYNNRASVFNPSGKGRLAWATSANKELARRFIEGMTPSGGTNHEEAILEALKLQPDVIFVLSDAKSNLGEGLSAGQLDKVRRLNGGRASINTIEFGDGPQADGNSFLRHMARENRGQYGYVDVNTLEVRRSE